MVPVLNSMEISAAVYGNHDFGESSFKIQLKGRGWLDKFGYHAYYMAAVSKVTSVCG